VSGTGENGEDAALALHAPDAGGVELDVRRIALEDQLDAPVVLAQVVERARDRQLPAIDARRLTGTWRVKPRSASIPS